MPARATSTRPDLSATARALTDSLRNAFSAAGYTLASDAELVQLLSQPQGTPQRQAALAAGIGAIVYTELGVRSGELRADGRVLDVWRSSSMSADETADLDKPLEVLGVVRDVTRSLDRVSWRSRDDPRTVVVFDFDNQTGADSLNALAQELASAVRAQVAREFSARIVTDPAVLATRDVMERREVAVRQRAGAIVTGTIQRARNDSITIRLAARDLSEDNTFPTVEERIPMRSVVSSAAPALAKLIETMRRVNWGPRGEGPR